METIEKDLETFYAPAGAVGPWRSVQQMLRQKHESTAEDVQRAIDERIKLGIPLDNDAADWREDAKARVDEAWKTQDREKARSALRAAWFIAIGGLRPLDPYVADPSLNGLEVKLRALSRDEYAAMTAEIMAHRYAGADSSGADAFRALAAQQGPTRAFVSRAIVGIRGVQLEHGEAPAWEGEALPPFIVSALDAAGLITVLHVVADRYQELGPLQRRGFGSPHPSTSLTSIADPARPPSESPAAAAETSLADRISPASTSPPTAAPWPTSVRVTGSETPSVTTALATATRESTPRV